MKHKNAVLLGLVVGAMALSTSVSAAPVKSNIINAANPGSGDNFWIPTDAQKMSKPYMRGKGQDWEWRHAAITGKINSATLSIKAYDVDKTEVDNIYGFNNDTSTWDILGTLTGSNNTYSVTTFNLASNWLDEVALGLKIMIGIDKRSASWRVALENSQLSASATQTPVPAAAWLFGSGLLAGLLGMRKKPTFTA
jgi:hypothetical protein